MTVISFVLTSLIQLFAPGEPDGALFVHVENIRDESGRLYLAVYPDEASFMHEERALVGKIIPVNQPRPVKVALPGLFFGRYAVAVYHDCNGNGKLDRNLFGLPIEPYAFSNNPNIKWRPPTFDDAVFDFRLSGQELTIQLRRWKER